MNKRITLLILITITTVISITANAQFSIGGPGTNGSTTNANGTKANGANNSPSVPFDGDMSLILLISGVGLGTKKLRNKQKGS